VVPEERDEKNSLLPVRRTMINQLPALIFSLLILSLLSVSHANGQVFDNDYTTPSDNTIDLETGIALRSDYMHRGQNLYDGASVQPEIKLNVHTENGTFHGRVFAHISADQGSQRKSTSAPFETTNDDDEEVEVVETTRSFNEMDYEVGYSTFYGMARVEVGNRWYEYDETTSRLMDTTEAYGRIDIDTILNPYVTAAYDWDERDGWYYEMGVWEPIPLQMVNEGAYVAPSITLGFNSDLNREGKAIYDDSGLVFVDVGLKGNIPVTESVSLEPEAHYNEATDDFADSELWFGINLKGTFGF